jgi:hypothetical protein
MTDDAHGVEKGGTVEDLRCHMKKSLEALLEMYIADPQLVAFLTLYTRFTLQCSLNVNTKDRRLM